MNRAGQAAVFAVAVVAACSGSRDRDEAGSANDGAAKASPSLAPAHEALAPRAEDCPSWANLDVDALPALPPSDYTATFESVWRTILEKHYDPTLACLDWPAIRETYGKRVASSADRNEAYAQINAMLATLGQSHLRAVPPGDASDPAAGQQNTGPALAPLTVRILEGEPVVTRARLEGKSSGVPLGAVLVEVDGQPVEAAVREALAREGRDAERRLHAAREVSARLHCPEGGSKAITFRPPTGSQASVTLDVPCVMPSATESLGNLRDVPVRVSSRMIADTKIGYLAFNVWMVPLMSSQIRPALAALKREGMRALILDLRGNPGGVGAMSIPMARELSRTKLDLGRLQMRDMAQEYKPDANPEAFDGPVILLVDEGTASTSEIFAMGMRDAGRVKVVGGSTSAGMALPSLMEELPDGGRLQYVVGAYTSPKGTVPEGEGIAPDVLVNETRADYGAGKDPVLEAAVELARDELEGGE